MGNNPVTAPRDPQLTPLIEKKKLNPHNTFSNESILKVIVANNTIPESEKKNMKTLADQ